MADNELKTRLISAFGYVDSTPSGSEIKNWADVTDIPKKGEVCYGIEGGYGGIVEIKIGNGVDPYADLPAFTDDGNNLYKLTSPVSTTTAANSFSATTYLQTKAWDQDSYHNSSTAELTIPVATTGTNGHAGLMSKDDKTKLNTLNVSDVTYNTSNRNLVIDRYSGNDTTVTFGTMAFKASGDFLPSTTKYAGSTSVGGPASNSLKLGGELPSYYAPTTYVDSLIANATHFKGGFEATNVDALKAPEKKIGDMYVNTSTATTTFYNHKLDVGDAIIFQSTVAANTNPTSADFIAVQGTVKVENKDKTITYGSKATIANVEGVDITLTVPTPDYPITAVAGDGTWTTAATSGNAKTIKVSHIGPGGASSTVGSNANTTSNLTWGGTHTIGSHAYTTFDNKGHKVGGGTASESVVVPDIVQGDGIKITKSTPNATAATVAANLKTATKTSIAGTTGAGSSKVYSVQMDKDGYLAVNVPWTDADEKVKHTATTSKIYPLGVTGTAQGTSTVNKSTAIWFEGADGAPSTVHGDYFTGTAECANHLTNPMAFVYDEGGITLKTVDEPTTVFFTNSIDFHYDSASSGYQIKHHDKYSSTGSIPVGTAATADAWNESVSFTIPELGWDKAGHISTTASKSYKIQIPNSTVTSGSVGLVPKLPNDATKYLNGTGGWTVPPDTKYSASASDRVALNGTTFYHTTAITAGQTVANTASTADAWGESVSFSIPEISYDKWGHTTAVTSKAFKVSIPGSSAFNYTIGADNAAIKLYRNGTLVSSASTVSTDLLKNGANTLILNGNFTV